MINKDRGDNFWISWGENSSYEGGHRAHGGPPSRENPTPNDSFGRSAVVSPAVKKQFYKELQTLFLIENNNKNNRTIETKQWKIRPCFQKRAQ